jgi:hypothetical protein
MIAMVIKLAKPATMKPSSISKLVSRRCHTAKSEGIIDISSCSEYFGSSSVDDMMATMVDFAN